MTERVVSLVTKIDFQAVDAVVNLGCGEKTVGMPPTVEWLEGIYIVLYTAGKSQRDVGVNVKLIRLEGNGLVEGTFPQLFSQFKVHDTLPKTSVCFTIHAIQSPSIPTPPHFRGSILAVGSSPRPSQH